MYKRLARQFTIAWDFWDFWSVVGIEIVNCLEIEELAFGRYLTLEVVGSKLNNQHLSCRSKSCLVHAAEEIHNGYRSRDGLRGEKTGHGNHSGTSVLLLNSGISLELFGAHPLLPSHPVESQISGDLRAQSSEVVSRVTHALALGDHDKCQDESEAARVLTSPNAEGLGPIVGFRGAGEVPPESLGSPNVRPREHGHASLLDLGLLEELGVGEHVRERSLDLVHLGESHGIEVLASELGVVRDRKGRGGLGHGGRGEGRGRADDSGEERELHGEGFGGWDGYDSSNAKQAEFEGRRNGARRESARYYRNIVFYVMSNY